jgi:hypothetical protein
MAEISKNIPSENWPVNSNELSSSMRVWEELTSKATAENNVPRKITTIKILNDLLKRTIDTIESIESKTISKSWVDTDVGFFTIFDAHVEKYFMGENLLSACPKNFSEEVSKIKFISDSLSGPLEIEYLDKYFFQTVFPLNLVQVYAQIPKIQLGCPHYDDMSTLQCSVLDIFHKFHLQADTRFHPKIRVSDMPMLTFMQRNTFRSENRADESIISKYFSSAFDLKAFTLRLLKRLFSPSASAALTELHLQSVSLSILLSIFELGLMEASELSQLCNVLIEKIDHLAIQQNEFNLKCVLAEDGHGLEAERIGSLVRVFDRCRETVMEICLHIVFLHNDENVTVQKKKGLFTREVKIEDAWRNAYSTNPDLTNVINRIFTNYLLSFPWEMNKESSKKIFGDISNLISLTIDGNMDLYLRSAQLYSPEDITYQSSISVFREEQAMQRKKKLIAHAETLIIDPSSKDTLKDLESTLGQIGSNLGETDQYALGRVGVLRVMLHLLTILIEHQKIPGPVHPDKDAHNQCIKAIVKAVLNITKNNRMNKIALLHSDCHIHWRYLFWYGRFTGLNFLIEVFKVDTDILVVHKEVLEIFLEVFKTETLPRLTIGVSTSHFKTFSDWITAYTAHPTGLTLFSDLLYFHSTLDLCVHLLAHCAHPPLSLTLQSILLPPLLTLFSPHLSNGVNTHREQIDNDGDREWIDTLTRKYSEGKMSSEHLTDLLLEVGFSCMSVVAECTHGLYDHSTYKEQLEHFAVKMLTEARYLDGMPAVGLKYRGIVLAVYSSISVMQTYHLDNFMCENNENIKILENYCQVINEEMDRFKQKVEKHASKSDSPKEKAAVADYFYNGLIPLIYKVVQGMKTMMPDGADNPMILDSLKRVYQYLCSVQTQLGSTMRDLEAGDDPSLDYVPTSNNTPLKNGLEEKLIDSASNKLPENSMGIAKTIQDKSEVKTSEITKEIENIIVSLQRLWKEDYYSEAKVANLKSRYSIPELQNFNRELPIYGLNKNDPNRYFRPELLEVNREVQTSGHKKKDQDRMKTALTEHYPIPKSPFEKFIKLMESYRTQKNKDLDKPTSENTLFVYMNSASCNNDNIIGFIRLISKVYYTAQISAQEDRNPAEREGYLLEIIVSPIIMSVVSFLKRILVRCKPISAQLVSALKEEINLNGEESPAVPWVGGFVHILVATYKRYTEYLLSKLFFDEEYNNLRDKQETLCWFFESLCEGNNMDFKLYFSQETVFLPGLFKHKGLKRMSTLHKKSQAPVELRENVLIDIFIGIYKKVMSCSTVHKSSSPVLKKEDRPEILWMAEGIMSILAETASGPCEQNQKRIFELDISRECFFMAGRVVNCVDSSFNTTKSKAVDLLLALTEGDERVTDINKKLSTKIPFEDLYELIILHIKILYNYIRFKDQNKKFNSIIMERDNQETREKEESTRIVKSNNTDPKIRKIYKIDRNLNQFGGIQSPILTRTSLYFDASNNLLDPRIITRDILNVLPIRYLRKIEEAYKTKPLFEKHVYMDIAMKLNDMLLKFTDCSNSYKSGLHKLYRNMLDAYKDKLPDRISLAIGMYEEKEKVGNIPEDTIIYTFLTMITSEVEIKDPQTGNNHMIQFRRLPKTFHLSKKSITDFLKEADTDCMIQDLMEAYHKFDSEMKLNQIFYEYSYVLYLEMSRDSTEINKVLLWLIGLLINIVLVHGYTPSPDGAFIKPGHKSIINSLCYFLVITTAFRIVMWALFAARQIVARAEAAIETKEKKTGKKVQFRLIKMYFWQSLAKEPLMWNLLLYLIIPILGMYHDPFYLSLLPLFIVFFSKTLQAVAKSQARHFKQLVLTLMLAFMAMYSYSVLTIGHYWRELEGNQSQNGEPPKVCITMWECMLFVVSNGLRSGGGLADKAIPQDPNREFLSYSLRFLFDMLFYLAINVFSLNIILSVIVDSFAGMREDLDRREEIIENVCMVCSGKRKNIERRGESFRSHIEDLHNPLNYLYFLSYIYSKDPGDLSGLENRIYEQVMNNQIQWVPFEE